MLLTNFPEQLVYPVVPDMQVTLAHITSVNSFKTVPLLGKQKQPQQPTSVMQLL